MFWKVINKQTQLYFIHIPTNKKHHETYTLVQTGVKFDLLILVE